MSRRSILRLILMSIGLFWCCNKFSKNREEAYQIKIVGAMKDAMWKGELFPKIHLDSIKNEKGLYGIGPMSYMRGEILILNGTTYLSYIDNNNSLVVEERNGLSAPFFVYANASAWDTLEVPQGIRKIEGLEDLISNHCKDDKTSLFKLKGTISSADIHVQNLPEGSVVSSPKEAHAGQRKLHVENQEVEIIGFYSTQHQGIFTHHDSYLHMHLITEDKKYMGHLDELEIEKMQLLLPKRGG